MRTVLVVHTVSGSFLLAAGAILFLRCMGGVIYSGAAPILFSLLSVLNAGSGCAALASKRGVGPTMFRAASLLQLGSASFVVRLSAFPRYHDASALLLGLLRGWDFFSFLAILASLVTFSSFLPSLPFPAATVAAAGTAACLTFAAYPLQTAISPSAFSAFPDQEACLVSFVFVPASTLISGIMFAATLFDRRRIGASALLLLSCLVPLTVASTVAAQEVFFPRTSTQQLWVGVEWLDPSLLLPQKLRRTASANRLARAWRERKERRDAVRRRKREKDEADERRRRFRRGEARLREGGGGREGVQEDAEEEEYEKRRGKRDDERGGEREFLLRRGAEERRRAREQEWREREGRRAVEWEVNGPSARVHKAAEWGKRAARRLMTSLREER